MAYTLSPEAAEFYESTFVPALFGPWAQRLVAAAGIGPGDAVLDVACGTGAVARAAADLVGESGSVTGLDRNPAMLGVARRCRPDGVRWRLGEAGALPFADGGFDAVLSQAALMFFDDRVAALREMRRVTTAGGVVAVQVPGRRSASPGYLALAEVVERHATPEIGEVLGGYFAAGDPDLLAGLFPAAGLAVERLDTWLGATRMASLDTFLAAELLPIADRVEPAVHDRIVAGCRTALAPFVDSGGRVAAPIEVHLVTARRAG